MDNNLLQLSFAIYNNPGVYAVLLGSGVSRSAGIPTGWEVVVSLISQIAAASGEAAPADPEAWYRAKFNESPAYDALLARLGHSQHERRAILQPYFEPTDEEREQGIKQPSAAHRAIASLVSGGFIKVILTTNFDRLMEKALDETGISYTVISSIDMLKGAIPLQHASATVIKIHGDYLDGRIKNTLEELSTYEAELDSILDRVFDEYGIIVCGWSAEWDIALRAAMERAPGRHYSTYWAAHGALKPDAIRLTRNRRAQTITITSADELFTELAHSIDALQFMNRSHPLSTIVAIERIKRWLPSEISQLELEDFLNVELESTFQKLSSQSFIEARKQTLPNTVYTSEDLKKLAELYFSVIERTLSIVLTMCWYGNGKHHKIISRTIARWMELSSSSNLDGYEHLPVLFLVYTVGISSLEREAWLYLRAIFADPIVRSSNQNNSTIFICTLVDNTVGEWVHFVNVEEFSDVLHNLLRPLFESLLPSDQQYNNAFDLFEMIWALGYLAAPDSEKSHWMPPHSNYFKRRSWEYLRRYWLRASQLGNKWDLFTIPPFTDNLTLINTLKSYGEVARDFVGGRRHCIHSLPNFAEIYERGTLGTSTTQ